MAPIGTNNNNYLTVLGVKIMKKPEWLVFILSYLSKPREAGTPFSCSTYAAEKMVRHIPAPDNSKPRVYLEIGPGTGVVTDLFVKKLGENDKLHVVEIEEGFYEHIRQKFQNDPRVIVHHADISTWSLKDQNGTDVKFDAIATGVPLNNLPTTTILKGILLAYERLAKLGAEITAVEYVGTGTICKLFRGKEAKEVVKMKEAFFAYHDKEPAAIEYRNIPVPARVHRLQINNSYFKSTN